MSRDRSTQKKSLDLGKTYSIRSRFLATVIFAILAITAFVGGTSIYEVDIYIQNQAKNYVGVSCDNEAERINNSLKSSELRAVILKNQESLRCSF